MFYCGRLRSCLLLLVRWLIWFILELKVLVCDSVFPGFCLLLMLLLRVNELVYCRCLEPPLWIAISILVTYFVVMVESSLLIIEDRLWLIDILILYEP